MHRKLILAALSLTLMLACSRAVPGGFWNTFESDLCLENRSDQGPWGGTRACYWKSESPKHFDKGRIIHFASSHGWNLVDSIKYEAEEIEKPGTKDKPGFTIELGPFFEPSSREHFLEYEFPRWTHTQLTLYRFKTGWVKFNPGTDESSEISGFILISDDEKEMTVYHIWGE